MQITKCANTAETGKAGESSRDVRADLCSSWPGQHWKCYHESKPTGLSTVFSNYASSPRRKQLEARASHPLYWLLLLYFCPEVSLIYFCYSNNPIETMCQLNCLLLIILDTWVYQWFICNSLAMLTQYLKQNVLVNIETKSLNSPSSLPLTPAEVFLVAVLLVG